MHLQLLAGLFSVVFSSFSLAAQTETRPPSPKVEDENLVVHVGDYRIAFSERKGWTMTSLSFRNLPLFGSTGANQAVVHVKPPYEKEGDHWIGTAHGREAVQSVRLLIDNKEIPQSMWMQLPPGKEMAMEKHSRLGPIGQVSRTRLTSEGLEEDVTLTALEDGDLADFLYVFMHCWMPAMTHWQARTTQGLLADRFYKDDRRALMQDIRWLTLFSSDQGYGAVIAYPETYKGIPSYSNILWNRPRDNKHYLKIDPPRGKGTQARYQCRVVGYVASGDWQSSTAQLADKLAENFRPAGPASVPSGHQ